MAVNDQEYRAFAGELDGWSHIRLLTHERPDGDALGSLVGLGRLLRATGRSVRAEVFDEIPPRYAGLVGSDAPTLWLPPEGRVDDCDGCILVDTCAFGQLTPAAALLRTTSRPVLAIDHHVTRDIPVYRGLFDPTASAACLLVAELAWAMGWAIDPAAATALFGGIATDTGWFRFSNTDARTLRAAARLVECGALVEPLHRELYQTESLQRIRLLGRVLQAMEVHAGGRLAAALVTQEMLDACEASHTDMEDMINELQRIRTVDASVLLLARPGMPVKISLRSKGMIDVAEIAAGFGGGGHRRAAGLRLDMDGRAALHTIVTAMQTALKAATES